MEQQTVFSHRTLQINVYHLCFVFGRFRVHISPWSSGILTFLIFFSVPPRKCRDKNLNQGTILSFHILSSSTFTIIIIASVLQPLWTFLAFQSPSCRIYLLIYSQLSSFHCFSFSNRLFRHLPLLLRSVGIYSQNFWGSFCFRMRLRCQYQSNLIV